MAGEDIPLYKKKSLMVRRKKKRLKLFLRLRLAHTARSLWRYEHWDFFIFFYSRLMTGNVNSNLFAQGNISRLREAKPDVFILWKETCSLRAPTYISIQPSNESSSLNPSALASVLHEGTEVDSVSAVEPCSYLYRLKVIVNTQVFFHMVSPWHRHPWYHWTVM